MFSVLNLEREFSEREINDNQLYIKIADDRYLILEIRKRRSSCVLLILTKKYLPLYPYYVNINFAVCIGCHCYSTLMAVCEVALPIVI